MCYAYFLTIILKRKSPLVNTPGSWGKNAFYYFTFSWNSLIFLIQTSIQVSTKYNIFFL